ncbi:cytochrome c biogenesis protein CcdA [Danxiaibacter flavus]|uniref:Cytochrome c biogenesis protein CcdA n=1 Tax=Danxiaibacter flavus TaxID=3049108 RepID=A0ABV3ZEQ5_9BACT|nr:cytochrome c biogenesis protein CcdA [Chitinophagaceae bacterium DXS]
MKRFILVLVLLTGIFKIVAAQDGSKPVQFSFSTERANDSVVFLNIKAIIEKGAQLFSTKKVNPDDAFVSSVQFDSTTSTLSANNDTVVEKGVLKTAKDAGNPASEYRFYEDSVIFSYPLHIKAEDSATVKGSVAWLAKKNDEFPNDEAKFNVKVAATAAKATPATTNDLEGKSLSSVFWLCFVTGLVAMFTPCVFPLIPVTVSFFLKRSKTKQQGIRNASWYSLSIILIYTIPTIIITKIFGDQALYKLSIHPVTNLLFFAIFILFGISLLGAYELALPSKWANSSDQQAGKGGFRGIFFMALTLVIVSFSCTGPIVGLLLGSTSQSGTTLAPILGMLGFGVGLALPFTIFALFPSVMQSLPKSGGWLNSVKVVFGFVELALALKFLSNVDLIYHWQLLNRDVFLAIWIAIALLLTLYLLGKIKFSHDSDLKHVSVTRLFFAIASFTFAIYLVPGLWGAPLKPLSGLIPPASTQSFNLDELQYKIGSARAQATSSSDAQAKPPVKLTDKLKVPFGLTAYFDLDEGLAAAKALNKPVMLDFTGHSCANCRKMEEQVWKNPEVLQRMKEDFVLISLYVDESTELTDAEKYKNSKGELIETVGDKNLDYEKQTFGFNAQPLYMFLDLDGKPLSDVKYGYDSDVQKFIDHLEAVKAEFKKRQK